MIRTKDGRLVYFEETEGEYKASVEFLEDGIAIFTLENIRTMQKRRFAYKALGDKY